MEVIDDPDVPTDLVQERESFGGLHYPSRECWIFFGMIEFIYAELAIPDNFLCRGGKLLREICEGILENNLIRKRFADLCGYDS